MELKHPSWFKDKPDELDVPATRRDIKDMLEKLDKYEQVLKTWGKRFGWYWVLTIVLIMVIVHYR